MPEFAGFESAEWVALYDASSRLEDCLDGIMSWVEDDERDVRLMPAADVDELRAGLTAVFNEWSAGR